MTFPPSQIQFFSGVRCGIQTHLNHNWCQGVTQRHHTSTLPEGGSCYHVGAWSTTDYKPFHAFNAHESINSNVRLAQRFEQLAGHCARYALCISRMDAITASWFTEDHDYAMKISYIRISLHIIEFNQENHEIIKIKHNLHKFKI